VSVDPILIDDVRPQSVSRPAAVADLGQLIRRAGAEGFGLFPFGGGTHLHIGLPPSKPGVAVDMTALDQVIDYPARDMTITVQAGITIAKLQTILATENQRLPIDVAKAELATVGGAIAVNATGPRRFGFGTLRDYVIGISFMDDGGNEVKAGGRVVKNVAGYDLCKLHIGALGTLGIVTQVTLKVMPRPDANAAVSMSMPYQPNNLQEVLDRVHSSKTRPTCVELDSMGHTDELSPEVQPGWRLFVLFEGSSEAVGWQVEQIRSEIPGLTRVEEPYNVVDYLFQYAALRRPRVAFKANLLPSRTAALLYQVFALSPQPFLQSHAGNGIVLGDFHGDLTLDKTSRLLSELRQAAVAAHGNLIVTRCPPAWKRDLKVWGEPRGDLALMRAVKRELDPRDLFNPGRFLV
jgi:glycolate oxidase FAD binding subunit